MLLPVPTAFAAQDPAGRAGELRPRRRRLRPPGSSGAGGSDAAGRGARPRPAPQPPAGSGPVISQTEMRFHPVNESIIEAQTYLYYIQTPLSRPSEGVWVPYNEQTEQSLLDDFKRLWATSFLDNLWIETRRRDRSRTACRAST